MGLLDEMREALEPRRRSCAVRTLLDTMPFDDANDVSTAMADPSFTHSVICNVLMEHGHSVGQQAMSRHRNGRCSCH